MNGFDITQSPVLKQIPYKFFLIYHRTFAENEHLIQTNNSELSQPLLDHSYLIKSNVEKFLCVRY